MPMRRRSGAWLRRSRTRETTAACRGEPRAEPPRLHNLALQNVAGRTHRFRPLTNASRSRPTTDLHGCFVPLRLTLILWAIGPSLAPAHPPYPSRVGANAVSTAVRSPVLEASDPGPNTPKQAPVPRDIAQETDGRHRVGPHAESRTQGRPGIRHSAGRKVAVNANIAAASRFGHGGAAARPASGKPCEHPARESTGDHKRLSGPCELAGEQLSAPCAQYRGTGDSVRAARPSSVKARRPLASRPRNATPAQGPLSDCRATSTAPACCASASSQVEHR